MELQINSAAVVSEQATEYFRKSVFLLSMLFSRQSNQLRICVHIKHVSKSVNSAGLLKKGMFSNNFA